MVIVKEIRIKCNYCTIHYSYGNGATSNIINHLRTMHLDKLENEELCDRVTSHYIDSDFYLKSAPLAVKHLPGQHKKEKIKDKLLDLMEKWSITDKVFGFVSDHASNVIDIAFNINNLLNQNHPTNKYNIVQFGCTINLLNLIIKIITKFTKINGELDIVNFGNVNEDEFVQSNDKCWDLLTILTKSELETMNYYVNIVKNAVKTQNSLNIKDHQLIKDVTPLWNSTYLMFERVYEQADAINEALKSREFCRKFDVFKLNEEEKESMEEIIIVLACFNDATVILSGSYFTTLSLVIPAIETLRNELVILKNDKPLTKCLKVYALLDQFLPK
ncbi:unnamed protein product [Brachionus calyciflorus]|uniref:BED-type domain-containing protein n=1 Tax=Brachionus calyciflorus TaxID=104777 RepID=A0A814LXH4_9BILA|nr:unnamed protein product [Brachionus calyciflorus]